jgi:hypothetical protein
MLAGYSIVSDKIWHWMNKYPYHFEITLNTKSLVIEIVVCRD